MSWKRQWLIKISGDQYSIGRIGNTLFLSGRYVKSAPGATSPNTASRLPLARETLEREVGLRGRTAIGWRCPIAREIEG